jgi:hypothetical protein
MSLAAFAAAAAVTILCMRACQHLAVARGQKAMPWMVAAAILGPLPLLSLAVMRKRRG